MHNRTGVGASQQPLARAPRRAVTRLQTISAERKGLRTIEAKAKENDVEVKDLAKDARPQMEDGDTLAMKVADSARKFAFEEALTLNDRARVFSTIAEESAQELFDLETNTLKTDATDRQVRLEMLFFVSLAIVIGLVARGDVGVDAGDDVDDAAHRGSGERKAPKAKRHAKESCRCRHAGRCSRPSQTRSCRSKTRVPAPTAGSRIRVRT